MPQKHTRVHTFKGVAREWLARQAWSLAESAAIRGTFVRDVFPDIGALPIREVTARHITAILERLGEQDPANWPRRCDSGAYPSLHLRRAQV